MKSSKGDWVFHSTHHLATASTAEIPPRNVLSSGMPGPHSYQPIEVPASCNVGHSSVAQTGNLNSGHTESSDQFQLLTREQCGALLYWLLVPLKCCHPPTLKVSPVSFLVRGLYSALVNWSTHPSLSILQAQFPFIFTSELGKQEPLSLWLFYS